MRSAHAASILLASSAHAKLGGSQKKEQLNDLMSVAGLRALDKLALNDKHRNLLFGDGSQLLDSGSQMFGLGGSATCGETCTDDSQCASFMGMLDLEASCDAGCMPEFALSSCDQMCSDAANGGLADGNLADGDLIAEQRLRFFGGGMDMMDLACSNCDFYKCCADGSGYETCKSSLAEAESFFQDWDMTGDWGLPDLDSLFDDLVPDDWNATNWVTDLDWDGLGDASGLSGFVEGIHSIMDEAVAEQISFPVACNATTCPIDGLCEMNVDMAALDLDGACSSNAFFLCAEGLERMCATECKDTSNFATMSMCSLCDIATCCQEKGAEASFNDCAMESIPKELTEMMEGIAGAIEGIAGAFGDMNVTDWFDGISFENITGQLSGLIEDVVVDVSIPEFCPEVDGAVACPIEGFCEIFTGESTNFDPLGMDLEAACKDNAFMLCAPADFEGMCAETCADYGAAADMGAIAVQRTGSLEPNFAICSLCSIATCCRDNADSTFEDCALGSVPQQLVDAMDTLEDSPTADAIVEVVGSPEGDADEDTPLDPEPEDIPKETTPESNPEDAPIEGSEPETGSGASGVSGGAIAEEPASLEISRLSASTEAGSVASGSHIPQIYMAMALAPIAALLLGSL